MLKCKQCGREYNDAYDLACHQLGNKHLGTIKVSESASTQMIVAELSFKEARNELAQSLFRFPYESLTPQWKEVIDKHMENIDFVEMWLTCRTHRAIKVKR